MAIGILRDTHLPLEFNFSDQRPATCDLHCPASRMAIAACIRLAIRLEETNAWRGSMDCRVHGYGSCGSYVAALILDVSHHFTKMGCKYRSDFGYGYIGGRTFRFYNGSLRIGATASYLHGVMRCCRFVAFYLGDERCDLYGCCASIPPSDKYLIPDGYRGWITISWSKRGAAPLPLTNRQYICQVPDAGVLIARTQIDRLGRRWLHLGESIEIIDIQNTRQVREKFFIGTEEQYRRAD